MTNKIKILIKKVAYLFIIVLLIAIILLLILKYNVEGEKNMPFELSSIIAVSTAEGYQEKQDEENNWNIEVYQNNDIFLNIQRNKNNKQEEYIKSITIENIKVAEKPEIGKIFFYRPAKNDNGNNSYMYNTEYEIDSNITYKGDSESDIENLKISNQGGTVTFRVTNKTDKRYISNDKELTHDGKLLNSINVITEQIKIKISFDILITLSSDVSYRANIILDLPVGNIAKEGVSNINKTNMKDIIFKRE